MGVHPRSNWASATPWAVPGACAAAAVAAAVGGDRGRLALRWEPDALASGEVWRLLTGHVVHLGWRHLMLNLAGLLLVWLLVGSRLGAAAWGFVLAVSVAAIDAGFVLVGPDLDWYVGLSGVLHGLLAAGVLAGLASETLESVALGVMLAAKLGYEAYAGPLPGSEATAGGAVIVAAHLYGAAGGALAWGLLAISARRIRPI